MAKASLKLPNRIVVTLEGTPDEVKHLLDLYGGQEAKRPTSPGRTRAARKPKTSPPFSYRTPTGRLRSCGSTARPRNSKNGLRLNSPTIFTMKAFQSPT